MKKLLLLSGVLVCATAATLAADSSATNPLTWLSQRGIVSTDEMAQSLSGQFTPEEREKLDKAVAKRNAQIQKSNEEFAATLRDLLKTDDAQIAKRVEKKSDEDKEAAKLALMKKTQPSRYHEIMRRKAKEKEKEQEKQP